ncbi:MAG TPA: hypothetical protein DHW10_06610 [Rhodospirillaceae bacterium]|nr:hypothetical protein [Rhodospirillaceae bacterium]
MGTQHSSSTVRQLTKKLFEKKHIAYGRILDHWTDIVGKDFAEKSQPHAMSYRKNKEKKVVAVLTITASSADIMALSYQKGVIIERINHLIGKPRIIDIKFEHQAPTSFQVSDNKQKSFDARPSINIPQDARESVAQIQDEALKERLERFFDAANR